MSGLKRLREMRLALRPERVIPALDRALEALRDPSSSVRARLREEQHVFSSAVLDRGCELGLRAWSAAALTELRAREIGPNDSVPEVTAVWLAGCIPTAAFAPLVHALLAGSAVYAKPASADRVSPALFRDALLEADQEVGRALELGEDPRVLEEADAVVAHGRDETVAELRRRVPVNRPFIGHGHKISVAVVGSEIDIEEAARGVAFDVALYDGRGCLSPAYVLVEASHPERTASFARALAAELGRLEETLPRGQLEPGEEAWVHELRARAAVRESTELLAPDTGTSFTVILEPAGARPAPGTLRTVPVIPVSDVESAVDWCATLAPHLSSVGQGGFGTRSERLVEAAARGGGSRVCPLGRLQLPPIDWHSDGVAPLAALVRRIDVEEEPG
jgi:hypothetical protein